MREALLLAVIITVSTATMGCEDSPVAKIASSPILVMDFIPDQNSVKIYIHGASDVRYDSLFLQVGNVTIFDEKVLIICTNVSVDDMVNKTFELTASAIDGKDAYTTEIVVEVLPNKDDAFHIDFRKGGSEQVPMGDLPWKHRLDET